MIMMLTSGAHIVGGNIDINWYQWQWWWQEFHADGHANVDADDNDDDDDSDLDKTYDGDIAWWSDKPDAEHYMDD